ncbi:hypothetical protein [Leptobacterium sp. I13]|uniref:hypothetical protein n=1 Tax=Leptobacterium meishanense TaxID=3128904 RepID=UPI0030EC7BB7
MKSFFFKSNKYKNNILGLFIIVLFNFYATEVTAQKEEVKVILESFVESYKTDPMALTATFGIQIGDDWWHVKAKRK